jgi:hypothetical protein
MWLSRQIPKHKIADMSKRRNQANKQKQNETTQKKSSSLSGGLYPITNSTIDFYPPDEDTLETGTAD